MIDDPVTMSYRRPPLMTAARAVAVIYGASMFMSIMDSQIVNVALPTISRDFGAPISSVQWIITGYLISLAVFIPASGWIGDRFGTKKTYLTALLLFTVASGLCAVSDNLVELVLARVLQGAGGGMMLPVGMAMLYRAYPPSERVNIARMITRVMVLAPATAPIIGGILVTTLSWHWIFLVNLPVGACVWVFGLMFLTEHREPILGRFDLAGLLLGGPGLALILFAVSEGPLVGWISPRVLLTGLAGTVILAIFVVARLYPQVGPRRLIAGGFVGLATMATLFSFAGSSTSLWVIRALIFGIGVSVSFIMLPVQAAAFAQIPSADTGHATAIFSTVQRTAAAVGVAVLTTVLAVGSHTAAHPPVSAFRAAYLTAAVIALVGASIALGVRDEQAAATMVRTRRRRTAQEGSRALDGTSDGSMIDAMATSEQVGTDQSGIPPAKGR
jgi:MFS family permease